MHRFGGVIRRTVVRTVVYTWCAVLFAALLVLYAAGKSVGGVGGYVLLGAWFPAAILASRWGLSDWLNRLDGTTPRGAASAWRQDVRWVSDRLRLRR